MGMEATNNAQLLFEMEGDVVKPKEIIKHLQPSFYIMFKVKDILKGLLPLVYDSIIDLVVAIKTTKIVGSF